MTMKISEYRGEEALELLADIMEPAARMLADAEVQAAFKRGAPVAKIAQLCLKGRKREILEILARLENIPAEEYAETRGIGEMLMGIIGLFSDPSVSMLFPSRGQRKEEIPSGSATEGTQEGEMQGTSSATA